MVARTQSGICRSTEEGTLLPLPGPGMLEKPHKFRMGTTLENLRSPVPGLACKVPNANRGCHSPPWACGDGRPFFGDHWLLNSQRPCVAQTIGGGFTKLQTLIYFPKALARAAPTSLASGCTQGSQLSLARSRRGCLTVEMEQCSLLEQWGAVLLSSGSQGRQWIPAPSSQEGTFSFGVPKKNCRTRSARSARQKSRARTWPMISLNCQRGGR